MVGNHIDSHDHGATLQSSSSRPRAHGFCSIRNRRAPVADSSQLFRIVRIESRRAQFVAASRLEQGLPNTSEVTILIDVPKSYRLRRWEA
jgi:hypothetical protein